MHVAAKDLMIIHNWKVIKIIEEPQVGNIQKYWMSPFPGFNLNDFPFVCLSGFESFNILNVNTGSMQILVNTPTMYVFG